MRRYIITLLCAVAAMLSTSCEYYGGDVYSSERLGWAIWDTTHQDIKRVNEIFEYITRYAHLYTIEDETQRETYRMAHFPNATISVEQNIHTIIHTTSYDTYYVVKIVEGEKSWHITRSGGNGYDLTVTPKPDGNYSAHFNYLYRSELSGEGDFNVSVEHLDYPIISYTGTLTMTDYSASSDKPLTITTEITDALVYESYHGITDGCMEITVYDALYDSTDEVKATILKDNKVIVEYLDTIMGYTLQ